MLDFPPWKRAWLWGLTVLGLLCAVPSLVALAGGSLPAWMPSRTVNLGLDLAGGSHIMLEAEASQVAAQRLQTMEESVRDTLRQASPPRPG